MMTISPIAIALLWITGQFGVYVGCRLGGVGLGRWRDVLGFHAASAAGLLAAVAAVSAGAWNGSALLAAAAALALHGVYSLAMLENWAALERRLASVAAAGAARGEIAFLAPLERWMRRHPWRLSGVAFAVLFAAVAWYLVLRPAYAASFLEYYLKYLPFLTDHGWAGVLDLAAMGDPRPRLLPLLGAVLNIEVRGIVLLHHTLHPAFGIAWLIYPAGIAALYWAVYLLSGRRTTALIASLIYAASPGQLDILVDYYIPAKPLVNLFFVTALLGLALAEPHPSLDLRRPRLGTAILFLSALGAVLSDETAVFLISTLGILALPRLCDHSAPIARRLAALAALLTALLVYVGIGFVALPYLQAREGYALVPLGTVMLRGVYAAMFGTAQPFAAFLAHVHVASLFETILSAHMIIGRSVLGNWTYDHPEHPFWDASAGEYGQHLAVLIALAALLWMLGRSQRRLVWSVVIASALFVCGQAVMIHPLAPYLSEVNYYASLSSIFVALLAGLLLGDFAERKGCLPLAALAAAWLAFTGFYNFLDTAQRHPGFTDAPLTWTKLRAARAAALSGELLTLPGAAGSADGIPHRSRIYLSALEVAMAKAHADGVPVDIKPLRPLASAPLYQSLHLETLRDPGIPRLAEPGPATLAEASAVRGIAVSTVDSASLRGRHLRGSTAEWNVDIRVAGDGVVRATAWRPGLMRLWGLTGRLVKRAEAECLVFDQAPELCLAAVVTRGGDASAYDSAGHWALSFRFES